MMRHRPPDRRPSVTRQVLWQRDDHAHLFAVTIGFDPETAAPLEVFAGGKTGSDMAAVISDACVLISIALQLGADPADLGHSLLKLPSARSAADHHASPLGAIVAAVATEITGEPAA